MELLQTGNGTRRILSEGLESKQLPFDAIPIIDFAAMHGNDNAARQQIANELFNACVNVGFFYVKNHDVPQTVINRAFDQAKAFFELPLEEKMQIHISKSPHHRGYVPLLEENTDPTAKGDLHEALDCALEVSADDPDVLAGKKLYGPNVWPQNMPAFREAMDRYYWEMFKLGSKIFRTFAIALNLPEDFFEDKITKPLAQLRILRYPPQTDAVDEKLIGTGAHSDYECFTILAQDQVGGLQVLNSAGEWISAIPIPGTFVVNVGDLMARWTNGIFASTVHRAINSSGKERFSIPYFFGPNYDTVIETLPSCINPDTPVTFPPVTTGAYILERFDETFAYRKLP